MTDEEIILNAADQKIEKLYKFELVCAILSMILLFVFLLSKALIIAFISILIFLLCALLETAEYMIKRKAAKRVERRMNMINKSLDRILRRFSQSRLFIEKREFEKEYGFLEE